MPDPLALHILRALSLGPQHAYGIRLRAQRVSAANTKIDQDALHQSLQLLEARALISSASKPAPNARRAKIYSLTPAGRKLLE